MKPMEILSCLCVVGVLATGVALVLIPSHRIEKASVSLIRPGMDQRQVEKVLGVPPGYYGPDGIARGSEMHGVAIPIHREEHWIADEISIAVAFGDDGKVVDVRKMTGKHWNEETWDEWLWRRIRLRFWGA